MKIYADDRVVPYKSTKINPLGTKADIDGLLARWGITHVAWIWDPGNNNVTLQFQINETINGVLVNPVIRLEPPRIWNKGTRNKKEEINWSVSMRVLHWYLKSQLEMAHLAQYDRTTMFLPYIQTRDEKTLREVILPRLEQLRELPALSEPSPEQLRKVIEAQR